MTVPCHRAHALPPFLAQTKPYIQMMLQTVHNDCSHMDHCITMTVVTWIIARCNTKGPLNTVDASSGLQENYVKLKRDAEANEVLLLAVREQLAVRSGELAQCQLELSEQKGRCSSMEISMNTEVASRERTERELRTAYLQQDAIQGQLDRSDLLVSVACHINKGCPVFSTLNLLLVYLNLVCLGLTLLFSCLSG